jgi:LysR family transcriptional regulator, transcriptional activator for dmlA
MLDRLADLRLFVLIVDRGSLTAAGQAEGLSPGAVSLRLSALERNVDAQLLRRSTRRLQLTEAGDQFYLTAKRILGDIDDLQDALSGDRGALKGAVCVSAPLDLGRNYVARVVDAFVRKHPGVTVSLLLSDSVLDLNAAGIDIAVRYGRLPDSGLHLRRLSSNRRIPVAAPKYLDRVGRPKKPKDLLGLNCMNLLRDGRRFDLWPFVVDGVETSLKVTGDRDANDGDLLRRWAIEGAGVALKSAWDVGRDLLAGKLEPLLVPYCPADVDLQLVMPPSRKRPRRIAMVADHITAALRQLDRCLDQAGLKSTDRLSSV